VRNNDKNINDWNEEKCFDCGKTKGEVEEEKEENEENLELNFYK